MKQKSSTIRKIIQKNIQCRGEIAWEEVSTLIWAHVRPLLGGDNRMMALYKARESSDFIVTEREGRTYIRSSRPCQHPECVLLRVHSQ